jgi:hypothetical protein
MYVHTSCPVVKSHAAHSCVCTYVRTVHVYTYVVACLLRYAAAHLTSWDLQRRQKIKLTCATLRHTTLTWCYLLWLRGSRFQTCRTTSAILEHLASVFNTSSEQLAKTYVAWPINKGALAAKTCVCVCVGGGGGGCVRACVRACASVGGDVDLVWSSLCKCAPASRNRCCARAAQHRQPRRRAPSAARSSGQVTACLQRRSFGRRRPQFG